MSRGDDRTDSGVIEGERETPYTEAEVELIARYYADERMGELILRQIERLECGVE